MTMLDSIKTRDMYVCVGSQDMFSKFEEKSCQ